MMLFSNLDSDLAKQAHHPKNAIVDVASVVSAACFAGLMAAVVFDASIAFFITGAVGATLGIVVSDPSLTSSSGKDKKLLPPRM